MSIISSSSSFSNDSLLHPHLSSINSSLSYIMHCLLSRPSSFIFIGYSITGILLLLPLCSFILYLGLQRQLQQRSSSSSAATMSDSDCFTYHMAVMELVGVLGLALSCCGIFMEDFNVMWVGFSLMGINWCGEVLFHILTCVERYLAAVHPIIYLSLRKERGIRIRNITIGCLWLLCFAWSCLSNMDNIVIILDFCLLFFSLTITVFCSVSVLCVLIRPRPGEQGGHRGRVDRSKQRAFYTIIAILGVLLLRSGWNLVWAVAYVLNDKKDSQTCVLTMFEVWFNLPSNLVLPVLFLHRSGKLVCCKKRTSNQDKA